MRAVFASLKICGHLLFDPERISVFFALQILKLSPAEMTARPFWEIFEMPVARDDTPWQACRKAASRGSEFVIHGVHVRGAPEHGSFTMRFRCAADLRAIHLVL